MLILTSKILEITSQCTPWTHPVMSNKVSLVTIPLFNYFPHACTFNAIHSNWKDLRVGLKLQALVYDILPPTTAIVDYTVGLEKLSAIEQFFNDAQMAVSL